MSKDMREGFDRAFTIIPVEKNIAQRAREFHNCGYNKVRITGNI